MKNKCDLLLYYKEKMSADDGFVSCLSCCMFVLMGGVIAAIVCGAIYLPSSDHSFVPNCDDCRTIILTFNATVSNVDNYFTCLHFMGKHTC